MGVLPSPTLRIDRRRPNCQSLKADGRRMLTIAEAAVCVRGDPDYVRKLIREGVLRATRLSPRKTLIFEGDLFRFLYANTDPLPVQGARSPVRPIRGT
jgi:excisionase family DNA binding protein